VGVRRFVPLDVSVGELNTYGLNKIYRRLSEGLGLRLGVRS
jgi:hypothetical protein